MNDLKSLGRPVAYIVRDIERALGFTDLSPEFYIITNKTTFANDLASKNEQIFLVNEEALLSTSGLLGNQMVQKFLELKNISDVIIFKPSRLIENKCEQLGLKLLNPPVELSSQVEEKISQLDFFASLKKVFLPYTVDQLQNLVWPNKPCVLQFNTSHTGTGTHYLAGKSQLDELQEKFPKRLARMVEFIAGPTFTSNNVVGKEKILLGSISYQITGIKPFTDTMFATIGNDFAYAHESLNWLQKMHFKHLARKVGKMLQVKGYKGAYGIDALWSIEKKRWYLLEVNARQPASVPFESILQKNNTILEAHVAALLEISLQDFTMQKINSGAQIILRAPKAEEPDVLSLEAKARKLRDKGYTVIKNERQEAGGELLRIRTNQTLIKKHGKLLDEEML